MKLADLHIHSTFSDSSASPKDIVKLAVKNGLSAIALTDHDSVEGIEEIIKIGDKYGLEIIPGVELASQYKINNLSYEAHFIGLFIDYHNASFKEYLKEIRDFRFIRAKKFIKNLQNGGYNISMDEVIDIAGSKNIGRPHIALALLHKGYVKKEYEAFEKIIGNFSKFYVKKYSQSPEEAIRRIKDIGGIAILAHPSNTVELILDDLKKAGLDGIEAIHTIFNKKRQKHFKKIAKEKGLLISGGSDYHGENLEGYTLGKPKLNYLYVERMKEYLMKTY